MPRLAPSVATFGAWRNPTFSGRGQSFFLCFLLSHSTHFVLSLSGWFISLPLCFVFLSGRCRAIMSSIFLVWVHGSLCCVIRMGEPGLCLPVLYCTNNQKKLLNEKYFYEPTCLSHLFGDYWVLFCALIVAIELWYYISPGSRNWGNTTLVSTPNVILYSSHYQIKVWLFDTLITLDNNKNYWYHQKHSHRCRAD